MTGEPVEIPAFDPPSSDKVTLAELSGQVRALASALRELTGKDVLHARGPTIINPPGVDDAAYKETGGKGRSGKGIPRTAIPGSGGDNEATRL